MPILGEWVSRVRRFYSSGRVHFLSGNAEQRSIIDGRMAVRLFLFFCALAGALLIGDRLEAQEMKSPQSETVPVSAAHALFGKQCGLCHEPLRGTSEKLCLGCHAGPLHNTAQAFTPPCWSCHVEHKEAHGKLASVANAQCVSCHTDLPAKKDAPARFAKKVTDFVQDHPQFAVAAADGANPQRLRLDAPGGRQADQAKIIFPHERHLKPDMKSPKGLVQVACKDCHVPAANGRQMMPVTYLARCAQCHPLGFDPQFPNRVAPHVPPPDVHAFLIAAFSQRREESPPPSPPERSGRLTRPVPSVAPLVVNPGVGQQVAAAERYLYSVTCNKCHLLEKTQRSVPQIVKTAIPAVWLPHARFAHKAHRMLECAACHTGVAQSKQAADVLLPEIGVCRECHRAAMQSEVALQQHSAPTDCVTCHLYHDKSKDVEWDGPFTVKRLLTEGEPRGAKPRQEPAAKQP